MSRLIGAEPHYVSTIIQKGFPKKFELAEQ